MRVTDSVYSRDCYDTCFMKVTLLERLGEALKTLLLREYSALEAMQTIREYIA